MKRQMSITLVLVLLASALLAACGTTAAPQPAATSAQVAAPTTEQVAAPTTAPTQPPATTYKDTIVIAHWWDPGQLDPAVIYDESAKISELIYQNLVFYDGDSRSKLVGELATSWTVSDDGLTYTFKLRDGVKFHDGTPFNADAVKFSFERMLAMGKSMSWAFSMLDSVEVVDPLTVAFHLKNPYTPFIYMLATRYASPIVSPSIMAHEVNGDWAEAWMVDHAIGTGPYMLTQWKRGEEILLDYYPDYWGGWTDKNIKHVVYKSGLDETTERQMLERGDADCIGRLNIEDIPALQANPKINVMIAPAGTSNFNWFILFNTRKGIFTDKRAREALSWAFPYKDTVEVAFAGTASQSIGPIPAGTPGNGGDQLFVYHQDIEKAKQILKDAGIDTNQTIRITGAPHVIGRKMADMLTTTLSALGFKTEVQALNWSAMTENMASQETAPDMVIGDWYDDYPDGIGFMLGVADWFWWGLGREEKDYFYYNADIKQVLEEGNKQTDPVKRQEASLQAQKMLVEDIPAIWVFDQLYALACQSNVKGYIWNPYSNMGWNLYTMSIEGK
jgi:peptide/nickel transport system substrate-binding protein